MAQDERVERLMNIGTTIARRLKAVGIRRKSELQTLGPVEGYRRIAQHIRQQRPNRAIPMSYYLYSLQGALLGIYWNDLDEDVKDRLSREAEAAGPLATPVRKVRGLVDLS